MVKIKRAESKEEEIVKMKSLRVVEIKLDSIKAKQKSIAKQSTLSPKTTARPEISISSPKDVL